MGPATSEVMWANPTVALPCTPGLVCTRCVVAAVSAPGASWICQSTATLRIARSVMVIWEVARKAPRVAISATATATPVAAPTSGPRRRRSSPLSQIQIIVNAVTHRC